MADIFYKETRILGNIKEDRLHWIIVGEAETCFRTSQPFKNPFSLLSPCLYRGLAV